MGDAGGISSNWRLKPLFPLRGARELANFGVAVLRCGRSFLCRGVTGDFAVARVHGFGLVQGFSFSSWQYLDNTQDTTVS
jgi:hypothetical protein